MKLSELFPQKRVLSFEVFPPKRTSPIGTVYHALSALQGLNPDFISVTFGAGGSANKNKTIELAKKIKEDYHIEPVVHLTCLCYDRQEIDEFARQFYCFLHIFHRSVFVSFK